MPIQPFSLPVMADRPLFLTLLCLWVILELFVGRHGLNARSLLSDRGSGFLVTLTIDLGLLAAFAAAWQGVTRMEPWVSWLGIAVMALGLALRVFSILWLGRMFTRVVQIVPGHRLITSGPYRFVRHPSYSGLLLFFLGTGLALGSWLSVAAMVLIPAVGIAYRIIVEERTLLTEFGDEYRAYMGRVKRLIPFLL